MSEVEIGQRLKAARERCGKTPNQIIASVGISVDSYLNLESRKDWFQGVTLNEICALAEAVELTEAELLLGHPNDSTCLISLDHLRDKLIEWLDSSDLTLGAFENRIGWEVKRFVKDTGAACGWNIDRLRAVCEPIGVDWTQVYFCHKEYSKPPLKPMSRGAIMRDVGILWGLTLAGGILVGASGIRRSDPSLFRIVDEVSGVLFCTIGFTIVGCLVGGRRWKHLFTVTIVVWVTSLVNIFFGVTLLHWLFQLEFLLIFMGIGGAVSYVFRR